MFLLSLLLESSCSKAIDTCASIKSISYCTNIEHSITSHKFQLIFTVFNHNDFCLQTLTALGSGYELSRRDMEMRGFGTIFGAEQSGTCDVGLDLQANILETAAKRLNKECILSISDSRISINCLIEKFGVQEIGILPPPNDLSGVSRWEASLAEKVIQKYSPKIGSKKRSVDYNEVEVLRNYLATGTAAAADALRIQWKSQLTNVKKCCIIIFS